MNIHGTREWHKWHAVCLNNPVPVCEIYDFLGDSDTGWMIEHNDAGCKVFIKDTELTIVFKLRFLR
jgi:hypothetical protein